MCMWVLFLDAVLGSKGGLWLLRTRGEWWGQHQLSHLFWHRTRAVAPGCSTVISQGASDSLHISRFPAILTQQGDFWGEE